MGVPGAPAAEEDFFFVGPVVPVGVLEEEDVRGFVVATGQIAQHRLTPPELHTIDLVASAAASNGIGKITLRCGLDPSLHPTLQRRLDKALKEVDGDRAFMIDMDLVRGGTGHTLYVICREHH